jgi:hypothetical protein
LKFTEPRYFFDLVLTSLRSLRETRGRSLVLLKACRSAEYEVRSCFNNPDSENSDIWKIPIIVV